MTDLTRHQKLRLKAHFGLSKTPFHKRMKARDMFDSRGQRELYQALLMWADIRGLALITGLSGVGKSITLRRFVADLDEARYHVVRFTYLPTTVTGFLRSFSRSLGLRMRLHGADLFDAARQHLVAYEDEHGPHPIILIDDAEGISVPVLDAIRRLTAYELDAEDRFSILLSATDGILQTLRHPALDSLRSRIGYAQILRAFTLDDARNYIRFHLQRADVKADLFTDDAVRRVFQATHGKPRAINQLCLQALVQAVVQGLDRIDGKFMASQVAAHPLYQTSGGAP
ncbi:MAG: AAA family ATPase [bacterium]|nr:AAA family ATPase [bacterium]